MAMDDTLGRCQRSGRYATFLFAWLLAGCATFSGHPDPVVDPEIQMAALTKQFDTTAVAACILRQDTPCRDNIAAANMRAIDIRFGQFETRLFRQTRESGFGATLATLGFTTAATLVHGSARAFSATAGLITGGREAFDKELLAQQTVLAIHSAMRLRRSQAATRIYSGLSLPYKQYGMLQLQRDLQTYEEAGNVLSALVGVNEIVGGAAKQAEAEMDKAVRVHLDPAATKIRNAICTDANCNTRDTGQMTRMDACLKQWHLPDNTLLVDVFTKDEYAYIRPAIAACMGL
jgi:hypothetical protein